MDYDLKQSIAVLERTPQVLRTMLSSIDREWTHTNYGDDTFSPFDVVGHLITGEKTDWIARARIILEHGPARPFDSYDRYAQFEASRGKSLEQLLDDFEQARRESLRHLHEMSLTPQHMLKKGTHPILGEVTLAQLLATWVVHDLNHITQIAKCMATQYVEAVGPWKEYLGVLKSPITRMSAEGVARREATRQ